MVRRFWKRSLLSDPVLRPTYDVESALEATVLIRRPGVGPRPEPLVALSDDHHGDQTHRLRGSIDVLRGSVTSIQPLAIRYSRPCSLCCCQALSLAPGAVPAAAPASGGKRGL